MQTFDLEGAAAFLKTHPDTVRDLVADGDMPGAKRNHTD